MPLVARVAHARHDDSAHLGRPVWAKIGWAYAHEAFGDGYCLGIYVVEQPQCPAAILAEVAVADRPRPRRKAVGGQVPSQSWQRLAPT